MTSRASLAVPNSTSVGLRQQVSLRRLFGETSTWSSVISASKKTWSSGQSGNLTPTLGPTPRSKVSKWLWIREKLGQAPQLAPSPTSGRDEPPRRLEGSQIVISVTFLHSLKAIRYVLTYNTALIANKTRLRPSSIFPLFTILSINTLISYLSLAKA